MIAVSLKTKKKSLSRPLIFNEQNKKRIEKDKRAFIMNYR